MRQPHPSFEIRAVNYQLPANESKPARFPQNPITEYLVMGETLGYKVDRISVILPDDTSKLKIVPGEDRVTLMTCTPYGVNTHRLLISGHRVAIPMPAPSRMTCLTRAISPLVLVWAYWRQDCSLSGWHDGTRPRASSATAHSGRGCAARAKAPMIRWPRPHADRPAPCPA